LKDRGKKNEMEIESEREQEEVDKLTYKGNESSKQQI
jgi:hypothetical protein